MMTEAMKPLGLSLFMTFAKYPEEVFNMKTPILVEA
jgi:hypothetical protein